MPRKKGGIVTIVKCNLAISSYIFIIIVPNWYTIRSNMIVISSREFRQHQKEYFEKVDKGEHVIVQRGKDKAYVLTPVSDGDLYFNEEMVAKLKLSMQQANNGETKTVSSSEEIRDLLGL